MPDEKTYRVFVSSTYIDNEDRRKLVEDAIKRADMIPVGMERFAADERPTVQYCVDEAAACDLLIGIIAHRYGWIPDDEERSITELEYDAAKHTLMFIKNDPEDGHFNVNELDGSLSKRTTIDKLKKLDEFKSRLRREGKPDVFADDHELRYKVLDALNKWKNQRTTTAAVKQPTTASIQLPPRLKAKLEGGGHLQMVETLLEEFTAENPGAAYFFPGLGPIPELTTARLRAVDALIPDDAFALMSVEDAKAIALTCMVYATILSVSPEEFLETLVKKDEMPGTKPSVWRARWDAFLSEASRYDGRTLQKLFGDTNTIEEPRLDSLDDRGRILIREFLKTRIALLAADQFGPEGVFCERVLGKLDESIRQIACMIVGGLAEHGIRHAIDTSNDLKVKKRVYNQVHVTFLMASFRLSMFLKVTQPQELNAPPKIAGLQCPIDSRIDADDLGQLSMDVNFSHDDPDAMWVESLPESARQYCALRDLLDVIQIELDTAWALLGEVYGRMEDKKRRVHYDQLCPIVRRIRCNVDDLEKFQGNVNYVPQAIRFETAGVDLLKLLVGPLYDNIYQVGIRELVQNAVDAVRERKHSERKGHVTNVDQSVDPRTPDVEVEVEIDDTTKRGFCRIRDRGAGMDAAIIQNYFLRAGATLRRSESWRELYEEQGRSQVLRSGRFGVGVLAAFLLGNRLSVTTRRFSEDRDRGIRFSCSIDDDQIELVYTQCDVGTTIEIELTHEPIINELRITQSWNWYRLASPSVRLLYNGHPVKHSELLPSGEENPLPDGWHRVRHPSFLDVQWSWLISQSLYCNGIVIAPTAQESPKEPFRPPKAEYLEINSPILSIFDTDGNLELNLARNNVAKHGMDVMKKVHLDMIAAIAANLIELCLRRHGDPGQIIGELAELTLGAKASKVMKRNLGLMPIHLKVNCAAHVILSTSSLGLFEPGLIPVGQNLIAVSTLGLRSASKSRLAELARQSGFSLLPLMPYTSNVKEKKFPGDLYILLQGRASQQMVENDILGGRIYRLKSLGGSMPSAEVPQAQKGKLRFVDESDQHVEFVFGETLPAQLDPDLVNRALDDLGIDQFAIWTMDSSRKSKFAETWKEILGRDDIPLQRSSLEQLAERVRDFRAGI